MVRKATKEDIPLIADLMVALWPHHTAEEMKAELQISVEDPETAFFAAGEYGFAQCCLRHDYVEGTESSPVGYLEAIYVDEKCRKQGVARALLRACENWAKEKGCGEFASDCELDNVGSLAFHLKMGFEEASRNIHFAKKI